MSDSTKSGGGNANSGNQVEVSEAFNKKNELAAQVAQLSPEGQEKCRVVRELSDQRMEAEKRNQQRSHQYRVYKQQVTLLENYVRDTTTERPPEIRADPSPDLKIIAEQAERMVTDREAFYMRHIEREADANIRQIIVSERRGLDLRRDDQQHDHEQER